MPVVRLKDVRGEELFIDFLDKIFDSVRVIQCLANVDDHVTEFRIVVA
jgi:hypothetical protein